MHFVQMFRSAVEVWVLRENREVRLSKHPNDLYSLSFGEIVSKYF